MTKQKEIEEWAFAFWRPVLLSDELTEAYIKDFFRGLSSRGVGIKVEKELPLPYEPGVLRTDGRPLHTGWEISGRAYQEKIIEAGCSFFEPLMEEKK